MMRGLISSLAQCFLDVTVLGDTSQGVFVFPSFFRSSHGQAFQAGQVPVQKDVHPQRGEGPPPQSGRFCHARRYPCLMPCYHPLKGFKKIGGGISWSPRDSYVDVPMEVPCGQCLGCRLERSRQWAVRIMHECQMHESNSFVTLTYDDEHLPYRGVLCKSDHQKFMKRLRKFYGSERISYFHAGEYGEENWRPHYHDILFGVDFPDRMYWQDNGRGERLYTSPTLSRLWGLGLCVFGEVTFDSAAYCARYCVKKVNGDDAEWYYKRFDPITGEFYQIPPEYATMSLKTLADGTGGIGAGWLAKFGAGVDASDSVVMRGREMLPPRYYDKKRDADTVAAAKRKRMFGMYRNRENCTPARLAIRERVKKAQMQFLGRKLK